MADGTKIEWTDATWNVVNGCFVKSPGCTNCYAMKQAHRVECRRGLTVHSKGGMVWTGEVRFNDKVLRDPMRWQRPRKIFVCAHGDLFYEKVPAAWIDRVFAVMALCPQHQFQVLTKRPERMRAYLSQPIEDLHSRWGAINTVEAILPGATSAELFRRFGQIAMAGYPLPNVWLGTSVEDQARADERIPHLLATPATVRWLSAEPLLGPISIAHNLRRLHWIVAGGESGPGARPMHPDWARSLRDQSAAADVPFLFKQWGRYSPLPGPVGLISYSEGNVPGTVAWPDGTVGHGSAEEHGGNGHQLMEWHIKRDAGRLLDGQLHDGFPA